MARRGSGGSTSEQWVLLAWLVGCVTVEPAAPPPVQQALPASAPTIPPRPARELYSMDEALRDVLSSQLHHVGTGRWPGIERSYACAFRNQRVLVVNAYCTLKESPAFRIDVFSPERGRVSIYAEANGSFSVRDRASYFTFTATSAPAPTPRARIPPVDLAMSYEELQEHERQRYAAYLPSCYGGERRGQEESACLGALAPHASAWLARNRAFLEQASIDWYRVVREMRALATRYGRAPD
jgi:hypothetical protein